VFDHRLRGPLRAAPSIASTVVTGLVGSLALSPLAWAQGSATRRRVPRLPARNPPHDGKVPGAGDPIRVIGIGESSVSGVGLSRGDER
jgi:hypothetical protein